MEKKSNFSFIPNWLVGKFTGAEYTLYFKMYNGWQLMKDADNWYYRSLSKLKEDLNITCKNNNKLLERIKKFEELGILTVKRGKQETNWYKFNEHFMFNNDEDATNIGSTPKGYKGSTPKGYKENEGVVPKRGTIYNTKENKNDNIHDNTITCTGENNAKNQHNMKVDERLITENEKDAWDVLSVDDNFDYTQYEDVSRMVQSDAGNKGVKNGLSVFDKHNELATRCYDELESLIKVLYKSWDKQMVMQYAEKFNSIMDKVDEYIDAGWFTSKQCSKFSAIINNLNSILEKKDEIFNNSSVKGKSNSSDESINSVGGCAAPSIEREDCMMIMRATMSDDEIAQLSKKSTTQHEEKKYGDYDSVDEWLKAYNEKWGLTTQEPMVSYNTNINAMNYSQC